MSLKRTIDALDRAMRNPGIAQPQVLYGREWKGGVQLCHDRACTRPFGWYDSWESATQYAAPGGGRGRFDIRLERVERNPSKRGKRTALLLLIREGLDTARWRGHAMSVVSTDTQRGQSVHRCKTCGAEVHCDVSPPPNGIDIGGDAVALNCPVRR